MKESTKNTLIVIGSSILCICAIFLLSLINNGKVVGAIFGLSNYVEKSVLEEVNKKISSDIQYCKSETFVLDTKIPSHTILFYSQKGQKVETYIIANLSPPDTTIKASMKVNDTTRWENIIDWRGGFKEITEECLDFVGNNANDEKNVQHVEIFFRDSLSIFKVDNLKLTCIINVYGKKSDD